MYASSPVSTLSTEQAGDLKYPFISPLNDYVYEDIWHPLSLAAIRHHYTTLEPIILSAGEVHESQYAV